MIFFPVEMVYNDLMPVRSYWDVTVRLRPGPPFYTTTDTSIVRFGPKPKLSGPRMILFTPDGVKLRVGMTLPSIGLHGMEAAL